MRIDGGCHCGAIRYEAEIDPDKVSICHCTDCQVLTGSPYRVTVFASTADVTMEGEPKVYAKTAQSGRKRLQAFCADCGAPIYATGEGEAAAFMGLRWGTVRQRAELRPTRQIWCQSMAPWTEDIETLPKSAEG